MAVNPRVCLYSLDAHEPAVLQRVLDWLEPAERVRALGFARAHLRTRFLAAQLCLRRHLGERLGLPPEQVVLARGAHGKPHLPGDQSLHFNLSHSGSWVLVASAAVPLGVDIEAHIATRQHGIAEEFLDAKALREWQRLGEHDAGAALTQAWCAREALLKLDGRGLALDPRSLELALSLPGWACWERGAGRAFVQPLSAPDGFHACLASYQPLPARIEMQISS